MCDLMDLGVAACGNSNSKKLQQVDYQGCNVECKKHFRLVSTFPGHFRCAGAFRNGEMFPCDCHKTASIDQTSMEQSDWVV